MLNSGENMTFENRMMNWRDTVLSCGRGGAASGCCSGWAAAYVKARNKREEVLAISLEITQPNSLLYRADVNELDGWLVEAAVRAMIQFDQKQILRYRYVWEFSNHFIKNKLHINDTAIRIVLGRAKTNLNLVLEKLESPVKIRAYNLHARSVPRPEALAVPSGTPAPLGKKEALID